MNLDHSLFKNMLTRNIFHNFFVAFNSDLVSQWFTLRLLCFRYEAARLGIEAHDLGAGFTRKEKQQAEAGESAEKERGRQTTQQEAKEAMNVKIVYMRP